MPKYGNDNGNEHKTKDQLYTEAHCKIFRGHPKFYRFIYQGI